MNQNIDLFSFADPYNDEVAGCQDIQSRRNYCKQVSFDPQLHQKEEIPHVKQLQLKQQVTDNEQRSEIEEKTLTAIVDKGKFTEELSIASSKRFEELLIDEGESFTISESNVMKQKEFYQQDSSSNKQDGQTMSIQMRDICEDSNIKNHNKSTKLQNNYQNIRQTLTNNIQSGDRDSSHTQQQTNITSKQRALTLNQPSKNEVGEEAFQQQEIKLVEIGQNSNHQSIKCSLNNNSNVLEQKIKMLTFNMPHQQENHHLQARNQILFDKKIVVNNTQYISDSLIENDQINNEKLQAPIGDMTVPKSYLELPEEEEDVVDEANNVNQTVWFNSNQSFYK